MHASGKVRNYQIVVGITSFMCLPVTYVVLKLGGNPESAYITALIFEFIAMIAKLVMLKPMIGISIRKFLCSVVLKSYILFVFCSIIPFYLYCSLGSGWTEFFIQLLVTEICVIVFTCFIGISASEREFVVCRIIQMIKK